MADQDLQRIQEINAELEKRTRKTKVYLDLEKELEVLKKKQLEAQKELNKQFEIGVKSNKAAAKFSAEFKKAEDDLNKSFSARLQHLAKGNVLQALGLDGSKKSKKAQKDLAKEADTQAVNLVKNNNISSKQKLGLLSINRDIVDGVLDEGEATERVKALGIKKVGISGKMQENAKKLVGLEKSSAKAGKLSAARMQSFAKFGGIAAIVLGFIVKAVTNFSKKIDSVGTTFGYLTNAAPDFRNSLIDSGNEAIMIGKNLEDVLSVTSALSSEFGITLKESKDIAGSVLDTAVATGISNDEATKLFGTFMQIGNLTAKQAEDLIEGTAQLAAQKGVAPAAVLQDMAASAEEIAGFTKDGGENIAEAAVQARQMGLSLSTTAKIAEGLLDFESSIRSELEASILTGKQLNFQRARQLALEGDIAGATKNIVDQVGSEAEFNKLNLLQRQSLAKSIGVSVSEMGKLVAATDNLTLKGALAGKNFDDLVGQDALSGLTSIINSIKMVGAALMDELGKPIADMLKSFQESIMTPDGMRDLKNDLVGYANTLIGIINGIAGFASWFTDSDFKDIPTINPVSDFKSGPGGITHMMGPAGMFSLNPRDSVMGTTNRINDFQTGPAGSMGDNGLSEAIDRNTRALSNMQLTAGRGEIRVAMEGQRAGLSLTGIS